MLSVNRTRTVWFVVSPQNPLKTAAGLLNDTIVCSWSKQAIDGENHLRATDIEFKYQSPPTTVDTMAYVRERFPQHTFSIIMGSDSYQNLPAGKITNTY
ncbi:MAG: hypothetical protein WDM78_21615 [Puia sp.]